MHTVNLASLSGHPDHLAGHEQSCWCPDIPSNQALTTVFLHADARTLNGISGPFGYFDPSGLAASVTPAQVKRYRESELTHGRVCMLAATGMLTGEAIQDNKLLLNFDGHIHGPAIMHFQQIEHGFWEPLVLFIGTPSTH